MTMGLKTKHVPMDQMELVPNVRTLDNKQVWTDGQLRYTWKEQYKIVKKDGRWVKVGDHHFVELGALELTEVVPD